MFQREFAQRLTATPGSALWSRLSANVQLYAKVDHVMKVAKSCFRPPPMVESSVVRIVPLDPPPPVRFEEFDGLTRIIFARPNKVVHANFQAKGVMEMLETNWRTWASVNNAVRTLLYVACGLSSQRRDRSSKMSSTSRRRWRRSWRRQGSRKAERRKWTSTTF